MIDEINVDVKYRLLELFAELEDVELNTIEQWICSQTYKKDLEKKRALQRTDSILVDIGKTIKKMVPFEAELPTENVTPPTVGDHADCTTINTCSVDEFLYDQDEVEDLVKKGKLKMHYCLDCTSRNIQELKCVSHSMSRQMLQYIFNVLLPMDLQDKQILDVGSRLGSVICGAYHLTNASTIIGIELNKECCEVQEKIIDRFAMDPKRIKVIHSDVLKRSEIVENSNIVVVNNLDFFVDKEEHKQIWWFFKKHFKKGTMLILSRSIIETLNGLGICEEFIDWLSISKPSQLQNEIFFDLEHCGELFLYVVN